MEISYCYLSILTQSWEPGADRRSEAHGTFVKGRGTEMVSGLSRGAE